MNKYDNMIKQMKQNGIKFDQGLRADEIRMIEKTYSFNFTDELRELFSNALPISNGFYNWRDFSTDNVQKIISVMNDPIREIVDDVQNDLFWCDDWGEKPDDFESAKMILLAQYKSAPTLIPFYSHRYVPAINGISFVPVLSVHGSDIIYYGKDLEFYLKTEFITKKYQNLNIDDYMYVPFWSDIM
jgi:hypothetical protein